MSRHLMARFRHLHAAGGYDWQPGRPLAWFRHMGNGRWACKRKGCRETYQPDNFLSALVHHGEQQYGLVVAPHCQHKDVPGSWSWGIHRNDHGDHWQGPGEWSEWKRPARYYGHADSREEAMLAAQEDWERFKGHSVSERDRNLSDLGTGHGLDEPEGGYDIFGDGDRGNL